MTHRGVWKSLLDSELAYWLVRELWKGLRLLSQRLWGIILIFHVSLSYSRLFSCFLHGLEPTHELGSPQRSPPAPEDDNTEHRGFRTALGRKWDGSLGQPPSPEHPTGYSTATKSIAQRSEAWKKPLPLATEEETWRKTRACPLTWRLQIRCANSVRVFLRTQGAFALLLRMTSSSATRHIPKRYILPVFTFALNTNAHFLHA